MLLCFATFLTYFVYTGLQYAYIASSYAAKTVCSCVFVSGREAKSVLSEDLYAAPFVKTEIDQANQSVSTSVYGFATAKAIFRKGLGCTLVNELTDTEIRPQDAFMALGFEGQSVTIVPSKELVIVRLGCTPNEDDFNRNQFIKDIVAAVK